MKWVWFLLFAVFFGGVVGFVVAFFDLPNVLNGLGVLAGFVIGWNLFLNDSSAEDIEDAQQLVDQEGGLVSMEVKI